MRLSIPALLPGTDYAVQVRSKVGEEVSEWSPKFAFTTIEDSVLPKTPTNVSWIAQGTAFHGQWDKVNQQLDNDFAKVIRYDVELENSSGTLREVIAHPASDEPVQKFKLGEQKMTALFGQILSTVKMRVRAVTQNENKSAWSTPITATFAAPEPPTSAVVEEGVNFVKLSWTAPADMTGVDGYRVYSGTTAGFTPSLSNRIYQGVAPTATYNSKVYTKRYFKIRSYSRYNVESTDLTAEGTPQNPSDPAIPVAPTGVTWVAVGDAFHGEWNQVTTGTLGETGVKIDRYELEMTGSPGAVIAMASAPEVASGKPFFTLSYEENVARFIAAKASITMRVRAVTTFGVVGAWSTMTSAAINNPPAAPTGLTGSVNFEYIDLKWNAVSEPDLVGYRLYLSTTGAGGTYNQVYQGPALNYSFPSAMYTTDHHFQVKAYDTFGLESAASNTVGPLRPKSSFVVDTTPPAVPVWVPGSSSLTNNANGIGSRATVTWTQTVPNPDDLAGFEIRYRKVGNTNYSSAGTFDKNTLSANVFVEEAYVNYEFQIRSVDTYANYSAWTSAMTLVAPANTAPANVAGLTSVAGRDAIRYEWTAVADSDLKNYEVTFSTSPTFASGNITFLTGTATTLTVSGLLPSTTYYARVRAVDTGALTSASWSTTDTETTLSFPLSDGSAPSSSPTPVVTGGIGYLHASWPAITNNDIVTYMVYMSTTNNFTTYDATTKVAEVSGTSVVLEKDAAGAALTYGTTYYVKIIAKDKDGSAAAGTQGSGTPTRAVIGDITLTPADIGAPTNTEMNTAISTSASGKNKITYAPAAPVNGTNTGILGDTWFVRDATTLRIKEQWELTTAPSTWTKRILDGLIIANIDAGAITTGQLDAARINTASIIIGQSQVTGLSGALTTATTNAENNIKTLWGHPLNTTLIDGGDIYTNTVRASSIAVSDFTNYISDPDMDGLVGGWDGGTFVAVTAPNRAPGDTNLKVLQTTSNSEVGSNQFRVTPGDSFLGKIYVKQGATAPTGGNLFLRLYYYNSVGAYVLYHEKNLAHTDITSSWVAHEISSTVPAGAYKLVFSIANYLTPAATPVLFDTASIRRKNGGELIVDGSVQANKISAGTYTGGEFIIGAGGILKTAGSEVTLTSTGISVTGVGSSINAAALTTGTIGSGVSLTVNGAMLLNGNMNVQTGGYIKSTEYAGTTYAAASPSGWYLGRDGLRISTGAVSATALTTGTLGSTTGVINIAAGASLVFNGGYMKSTTYTGTAQATNPSGAGFYLGNDGIRIDQGIISASALVAGTISGTNTITLSGANAKIVGTGFELSGTGLTVTSGTIAAAALTITSTFADNVSTNMTTIDGSKITTGSIQSLPANNITINGASVPLWSIPTNGSATFANLTVRGLTVVGISGDAGAANRSTIQSANYNGTVGWKIDANGDAYFASGTFKGDITGASGTFSGSITGSAATVTGTITGNTYQTSSASTYVVKLTSTGLRMYGASSVTPVVSILTDGTAKFTGDISGSTGTFSGTLGSGISITSPTINGGIYQTSDQTNVARVVIDSTGIKGLDSGGGTRLNYQNSSGQLFTYGKMWAQGGISAYETIYVSPNTGGTWGLNVDAGGARIAGGLTVTAGIDVTGTTDFRSAAQFNGNNLNGCGKITVTSGGMEVGGVVDFNSLATGGSQQNGLGTRYVTVDANGELHSSATAPSSITVKHDINTLDIDYRDILALTPKTFRYNTTPEELRSGFIAEEAEGLGLDTWVSYEDSEDPEQPTGFDYVGFISALQLVNREQQKQIDELRAAVEALQNN